MSRYPQVLVDNVRRALGVLAALATVVLGLVGVASPAQAAVPVPPGCGQPSVSSTGHTLKLTCGGTHHHGTRYKVVANACDSHHCIAVGSSVVSYGRTATVTSGAYLSTNGMNVYWYPATGSTACKYSVQGGWVPWCDMQASIDDWASRHPSYDQGHTFSNWYGDNTYRKDCSGLVSMAWHLKYDPTTGPLATTEYTKSIARKDLRPGDILDDIHGPEAGHVVIFAGWNSDHRAGTTGGTFRVWTFGYGTFGYDSAHHELHDSFTPHTDIALNPEEHYTARRFVRGTP